MTASEPTDLIRSADEHHYVAECTNSDCAGCECASCGDEWPCEVRRLRDALRAEQKDGEIIADALDEERAYSAHLRDEVARAKEWHGIGVATRFMQGVEARRWAEWLAAEKEYYRKKCDAMEQDWIELEEDARLGFASRMQMHGISDELNATRAERDAARRWAEWFAAEKEYYRVNLDYADSTVRIKNIGISRRLTDLAEARAERDEARAVIERVRNACATPYDEIAADDVREIVEDFYSSREK